MSDTLVEREPHKAQLEEGAYNANIEEVEAQDGIQTKYGIKKVFYITFNVEGVLVRRRYNASWNQNSELYKLVAALHPEEAGNLQYDVANLKGDNCSVLLAHNTTETGDVWDNVMQVGKSKKPQSLDNLADDPELREA
jgi:hypothetical protein